MPPRVPEAPPHTPEDPHRPRRSGGPLKWSVAALVAAVLHLALVLMLSWLFPTPSPGVPPEPLFVSLREPEPAAEPGSPPTAEAERPADRRRSRPPRSRAEARARPGAEPVAPELEPEGEQAPGSAVPSPQDLSGIEVEPDPLMLFELAAKDPRIRRLTEEPPTGPFAERRGLERDNLPPALKHREIERLIAAAWKPSWEDIKDEAIAEVSAAWAKQGLVNWLGKWQEQLREQQSPSPEYPAGGDGALPPVDREPQELPQTFTIDFKTDPQKVAVALDVEPLSDGSWVVTIAEPSGHPFFDRRALEQIEEVANLFPEWREGYGSAVRYRLEADFVIVPPSTSSILGLSCAFPFCTPEELKELEVIHWFKKIIGSNVRFEGLLRAP